MFSTDGQRDGDFDWDLFHHHRRNRVTTNEIKAVCCRLKGAEKYQRGVTKMCFYLTISIYIPTKTTPLGPERACARAFMISP